MGEKFSIWDELEKRQLKGAISPATETQIFDPSNPGFLGGFVLGVEAMFKLQEELSEHDARAKLRKMIEQHWRHGAYEAVVGMLKERE